MKKRFFATVLITVVILIGLLRIARREESQFVGSSDPKGAVPTPLATETDAAEDPQAAAPLPEPEKTQHLDQETSIPPSASIPFIPFFSGAPYQEINGSIPFFGVSELTTEAFEYYSPLDELGRCGFAYANICEELMPTEPRGEIGMVKPTGWHTVRYDDLIEDRYLFNRCHLIGYQLAGENANPQNLITGTRYMNVVGMQPFEDRVTEYVRRTGNHVLYRVTPIFSGENLVASGVLMEAYSVEDAGAGVTFCVFIFNVQPGIVIDYASGESSREDPESAPEERTVEGYIGNLRSQVFHLPTCPNLPALKNQIIFLTREEAVDAGYRACGNCHP